MKPGDFSEVIVSKATYTHAQNALGKAARLRERISVHKALGFDEKDIEDQLNEWQPRIEAIIEYYHQQG